MKALCIVASILVFASMPLNAEDRPNPTQHEPRHDLHGDPIPAGADVRLGTTRLRHPGWRLQVGFSADGDFEAYHLAVSPDNRRLLYCGPEFGADDSRRSIHLCDFETDTQLCTFKLPDEFAGRNSPGPVAFSPDGRFIAAAVRSGSGSWGASDEDRIYVWDVATGKELLRIEDVPGICPVSSSLAISADSRFLACGQYDSTVLVWDLTRLGIPPQRIEVRGSRNE